MEVTYEGMDGPEVEATIAEVGPDRITLTSTLPVLPGAPIFEAATGAVVRIAESPSLILSAAVLSRPPFGRAGALGTLGGAGNDSVADDRPAQLPQLRRRFLQPHRIAAHDPAPHDRNLRVLGDGQVVPARAHRPGDPPPPDENPEQSRTCTSCASTPGSTAPPRWCGPHSSARSSRSSTRTFPGRGGGGRGRASSGTSRARSGRNARRSRPWASVAAFAFVVALARGYAGLATGIAAIVGVLGVSGLAKAASNPVARWVTTLFTSSDYGGQIAHMDEIKNDLETLEKRLHDKERSDESRRPDPHPDRRPGPLRARKGGRDAAGCQPAAQLQELHRLPRHRRAHRHGRDREALRRPARHAPAPRATSTSTRSSRSRSGSRSRTRTRSRLSSAASWAIRSRTLDPPPYVPQRTEVQPYRQLGCSSPRTAGRRRTNCRLTAVPSPPEVVASRSGAFQLRRAPGVRAGSRRCLRPNPRHLKRMVNVYRLVQTLAALERRRCPLQNPAAMIRWLVMWGQWPQPR